MFFDVTNSNSFERLSGWLGEIEKYAQETCKVALVGNKCDLQNIRKISKEEIIEFATKKKLKYFETSAKNNINIQETVEYLCAEIMCVTYPHLKEYLDYPNEWSVENHSKFPSKFKQSIFSFLLTLKRYEKKYKLKVPKVIKIEIIKRTNPIFDFEDILNNFKNIEISSENVTPPKNEGLCIIN